MQIIKNIQVNWSRVSNTVFSKHKAGLLEKASLGVIRNFRSEVTAWGDRISKYVVVNCLMEEYLDRMLICIWFRFLKNFDLMKSSKTTRWDKSPISWPIPQMSGSARTVPDWNQALQRPQAPAAAHISRQPEREEGLGFEPWHSDVSAGFPSWAVTPAPNTCSSAAFANTMWRFPNFSVYFQFV